jgi:hypothetical protein
VSPNLHIALLLNSKSRDVKPNLYSTAESGGKSDNANRPAEIVAGIAALATSPNIASEAAPWRKM